MKKLLFLILSITLASAIVKADDSCSEYYPLEEGVNFQYTSFNKKGKVESISDGTVTNVKEADGVTSAIMNMKISDKKGKPVFETSYGISCTGNGVKIDYESLFPAEMKKQYEEMGVEMDIVGTDIEFPNELKVGDELADANIGISINMMGMPMNINITMVNRKVEKIEKVTTSAGTFECVLISEQTNSKVMMANHQFTNKLWLAKGIGTVKQETYKDNGKLMSRMELTKFSR